MDSEILEIISDMESFIGENWSVFQFNMQEKGFTEDEVEEMGKKLNEFLEEEGYR